MNEIPKGKMQAAHKDACGSMKAASGKTFGKEAFEPCMVYGFKVTGHSK